MQYHRHSRALVHIKMQPHPPPDYLFLLTLHPQNKNRSIVLFPEQCNNIVEEYPDLEKEIYEDDAVEDADVYFPV